MKLFRLQTCGMRSRNARCPCDEGCSWIEPEFPPQKISEDQSTARSTCYRSRLSLHKTRLYTVYHGKTRLYTVYHGKTRLYTVYHGKTRLYTVYHGKTRLITCITTSYAVTTPNYGNIVQMLKKLHTFFNCTLLVES